MRQFPRNYVGVTLCCWTIALLVNGAKKTCFGLFYTPEKPSEINQQPSSNYFLHILGSRYHLKNYCNARFLILFTNICILTVHSIMYILQ